jgi:hypothetical protein
MASKTKEPPIELNRINLRIKYFFFIGFLLISWNSFLFGQSDSLHGAIPDGNLSKIFIAPTARSLPEDHGYINLAEIIFPNFGYGFTDEFMVRGGFTPFTVSGHILYFGLAQLQVAEYGDLTISGGILLTDLTGNDRHWENALYGYGIVSYGNDIAAIHAGFGGGYSGKRESSSAVFMVGGEWKVARTTKLISENWIVSETGSSVFSLGLRIFGRDLEGELGGIIITSQHTFKIESIVPWIGITFIL